MTNQELGSVILALLLLGTRPSGDDAADVDDFTFPVTAEASTMVEHS